MRTSAPQELAEDNACRIEHVITEEMFEYIKKFEKKQLDGQRMQEVKIVYKLVGAVNIPQ